MDPNYGYYSKNEETSAMLSAFKYKRDLEERVRRFDGMELELDVILNLSPSLRHLGLSCQFYLTNILMILRMSYGIWQLIDLAVKFQEKVKWEAMRLSLTTTG